MIFITSDLHFCHDREFLYGPRGFKTVAEMNAAIVANWNAVVGKNDEVYVLGDLMLNDNVEGARLIYQLNGRIHVIRGNHDTDERLRLYGKMPNIVSVSACEWVKYNGYSFVLTHFPTITTNGGARHLKREYINLCGHTHTPDRWVDWNKGRIYHCDLDAHNNTPVSLDAIIEDLENKVGGENNYVD